MCKTPFDSLFETSLELPKQSTVAASSTQLTFLTSGYKKWKKFFFCLFSFVWLFVVLVCVFLRSEAALLKLFLVLLCF